VRPRGERDGGNSEPRILVLRAPTVGTLGMAVGVHRMIHYDRQLLQPRAAVERACVVRQVIGSNAAISRGRESETTHFALDERCRLHS